MNNIRFILMLLCSSGILLITAHLSAEVSIEPFISKYDIQYDYPEVPSLSQPQDLNQRTETQHKDDNRQYPLRPPDSKQATDGLCDYMSNYSFAQATAAKAEEASTSEKP